MKSTTILIIRSIELKTGSLNFTEQTLCLSQCNHTDNDILMTNGKHVNPQQTFSTRHPVPRQVLFVRFFIETRYKNHPFKITTVSKLETSDQNCPFYRPKHILFSDYLLIWEIWEEGGAILGDYFNVENLERTRLIKNKINEDYRLYEDRQRCFFNLSNLSNLQ